MLAERGELVAQHRVARRREKRKGARAGAASATLSARALRNSEPGWLHSWRHGAAALVREAP